jgi:hypothetical protein
MDDGLHILTAGHVANNTQAERVVFDLAATAPGRVVPPIAINVPVGPNFQVTPGGFVNRFPWPQDISILRLTDQVVSNANRLLVAPYYGPQIGYTLSNGANDIGTPFTLVGYGLTGTGTTGRDPATPLGTTKRLGVNTFDADANLLNDTTETVGVTGGPVGGFFRLSIPLQGGGVARTGNIPFNANAATVQAALNAAAAPNGATPLAGNVRVNGGPGIAAPGDSTTWFVTFVGALAGRSIAQLRAENAPAPNALVAPPGGAVGTSQGTRLTGGTQVLPGGVVTGNNAPRTGALLYDFDNANPVAPRTAASFDAIGLFYGGIPGVVSNTGVPPVNALQTVSFNGAPTAGSYRLTFTPMQAGPGPGGAWAPPPAVTTDPIPFDANAAAVQAALERILGAGNVRVTGGPAPAPFTVEFLGALRGNQVNQLTVTSALVGSTASAAPARLGQSDNLQSSGDSGGPAFINGQIAGIVSYSSALGPIGQVPDIDAVSNNSYGEMAVMTQVSSYLPFINATLAATTGYDLVLDMNQQALGVDGATDDVTITARRSGANLQILVNDPNSPKYSGVYFNGPAARIATLTIRGSTTAGSQDNTTFIVQGNLGLGARQNGAVTLTGGTGNNVFKIYGDGTVGPNGNGSITVTGRGASNELEVHDEADAGNNVSYVVTNSDVMATAGDGSNLLAVDYTGINAGLEADGGSALNQWAVWSTPVCETTINSGIGGNDLRVLTTTGPLFINGQKAIDTVTVGNAGSVQDINGDVDVTNAGGLTSLTVDDSADATARNVVLTAFSVSGLAPALISWTPGDINNLGINGGTGGNTFTVRTTPPGVAAAQATLVTGTGNDTVNVLATQRRLSILGAGGRDQVFIGNQGDAQQILGSVFVNNTPSYTALTIDDSADPAPHSVALAKNSLTGLTPGDISWVDFDLSSLTITGSTVNTGTTENSYNVVSTPRINVQPAQTVLNTGAGSVGDTVVVRSVDKSALIVNGQNGLDDVTIGNNGNVQAINGPVTVTNTLGGTALTIDDSADPGARPNVTLTATSLTGLAPPVFELQPVSINWVERDVRSLVIKGGTGGNTFNVTNTPRNFWPVTTNLLTGGGNDVVNVIAARGPLFINGQAGDDRVRFLNFADSATVDGGAGNNTIEVAQGALSTSQVPFTNVQTLAVTGGSTLNVNTDVATGTILVQQGTLALAGGIPTVTNRVDIQAAGVLTGTGQINGNVVNGGQVLPAGAGGIGRITVRDDYTQVAAGNLNLDLQGPLPGIQSDNLEVGQNVQLAGALNLTALAGFNGNYFVLVSNRGGNAVAGTFAGLPEGAMVMVGGRQFQISYRGGDGNDVVLRPVGVSTAAAVGSSINPSVFGQPVTFTATITPLGSAPIPPSGLVTFLDGSTPLGTGTLAVVAGLDQATLSTAALAVGSHPITAVYAGDANFAGSTSPVLNQVVNKADTSLVLTSGISSTVYGQAIQFTATVSPVSPGSGTPTGTVQFQVDGSNFGAPVPLTGGQAVSPSLSTLTAGTHTIRAVYSGDGSFSVSSGLWTQAVTPAPLTITADNQTKVYGAAVPTLTASYSGFVNGDTPASLTTPPALTTTATASSPVGTYPINVSGAAAANYTISYVAGMLTVTPAGTVTGLTANSPTSVFGEPITFTAVVAPVAPGAGTPTGTVAFKRLFPNGSVVTFGTANLDATGTAVFIMDHFVPATATLFAVYQGDANFAPSTSPTIVHVINKADTTTGLSSNISTSVVGQPVNFTSTLGVVAPGSAVVPPTGTITYYDTFQGVTTVLAVSDVGGAAQSPAFTTAGTHVVTAVYSGDSYFNGSTSGPLTQVVNKASTHISLSVTPNPIVYGQTIGFNIGFGVDAPGAGSPTGTATITDTFQGVTTVLFTTTIGVGGGGQFSPLHVGTHLLAITYNGDSNFLGSTSVPYSLVVNPASTTTTLAASSSTIAEGDPLTLTITVGVVAPGGGTPTGTVTVYDTFNGTTTVLTSGALGGALPSFPALDVGTHLITAVYSGDGNFTGSFSSPLTVIVMPLS